MEYRIGNRKVSRSEWERHLREAPLEAVKDDVRKKIARVRCPIHGQRPRVEFRKTVRGFDTSITGCCDDVVKHAQRALG